MLRVSNLKFPLGFDDKDLTAATAKLLKLEQPFRSFKIIRKATDTRSRSAAWTIYTVDIEVDNEDVLLSSGVWASVEKVSSPEKLPRIIMTKSKPRPIIIGSGPAGMFAGLVLAEAGLCPLILERGKAVPERQKDVEHFWHQRQLNPESNVQFGEGGAGTFSDGKLMSGIKKDAVTAKVFEELVAAGAPEDILYLAKPHLGTDKLYHIVQNIRAKITRLGGEYRFEHRLEDIVVKDDELQAIKVKTPAGLEEIPCSKLILAIGHSARDTFEMLYKRQLPMVQKVFSVGARIEHRQSAINKALQHNFSEHPALGAADYKLSVHLPNGRSAYTFCMCPGGVVVAAASEDGRLVTNGMSYYARDKQNANSALLVGVTSEDFGGNHPLQGMYLQRKLEETAFALGGKNYQAPAQKVGDLLKQLPSKSMGEVMPSYSCGVVPTDMSLLFPDKITETLRLAIVEMDKKLHGFADAQAVLTGVETRSSSPIRMLRDGNNQSPIKGIYPSGEGAGYAGGIVSAAADGIKTALNLYAEVE